jgi:hypothetical protein
MRSDTRVHLAMAGCSSALLDVPKTRDVQAYWPRCALSISRQKDGGPRILLFFVGIGARLGPKTYSDMLYSTANMALDQECIQPQSVCVATKHVTKPYMRPFRLGFCTTDQLLLR